MPPRRRSDASNRDYEAARFFVFEDRLGIHDSVKSDLESQFHLNEFGIDILGTNAYPGRGDLAVVLKVAPDGRVYGLVRKATARDRKRHRGIFEPPAQPPPNGVTIETLVARLDAVDAALAEIRAQKPEHGGMGHNNPDGIDPELIDQTADASRDVRAALTSPALNPLDVHRKAGRLRAALAKLTEMGKRAPDQFVDGIMKKGGKLTLAGVLGANVGPLVHRLSAFLSDLAVWVHHMLP